MQDPQASVEIRKSFWTEASPLTSNGAEAIATLVATGPGAGGLGRFNKLRSPIASRPSARQMRASGAARALTAVPSLAERRCAAQDLHDGVQNDLVGLIIGLAVTRQDPDTSPELASTLAGLEARAQAVLDSVRSIARGIYPPLLAELGVVDALRAQAARSAIRVSVAGAVPRSTEEAEEAAYFSCSEAIQNAAKHAGGGARVTVRAGHDRGWLAARIADDGRGFDPDRTPAGAGLQSIRDRIQVLGGSLNVISSPRQGTVLMICLPWPARADRRP